MKMTRRVLIALVMTLLFAPLIHGQDLSRYRSFPLGASLVKLSNQADLGPLPATVIHRRPAVIQEVTWWPPPVADSSRAAEPVSQVLLTFYNGELYKILVTYDRRATEGLTSEDMVRALSAKYGTATRPDVTISFPSTDMEGPTQKVIARWEDSHYSVNLFRSSALDNFGLVMFSKQVNAQAEDAIAESVRLNEKEGPQMEFDRQQKEANDLEVAREKNKKAFRP
jgi:hypothetical protein